MSLPIRIRARLRRPLTWIIAIPVVIVILATLGPYLYLHSVSSHNPKPLSFSQLQTTTAKPTQPAPSTTTGSGTSAAPAAAAAPAPSVAGAATTAGPPTTAPATASAVAAPDAIAGTWTVGGGSQARYGIDDTVLGQSSRVVGSTSDVSGSMQITGTTVTAVRVVVDMAAVRCGCVHDAMYPRLLETGRYPTATFNLSSPIDLGAVPTPGTVISVPVTGSFTIHGVTRTTSFTLQATDINGRIAVKGSIPVSYQEYSIVPPPGGGVGGLSNTTIDLLVAFDKSS